jgi:hypothetical protein
LRRSIPGAILGSQRPSGVEPGAATDFPIAGLMDPDGCYVERLHPDGFGCPRCREGDHMRVHRGRRLKPAIVVCVMSPTR